MLKAGSAALFLFSALVVLPISVYCTGGGFPAATSLLTLERAFPVNERVEFEVLRARDRARHSRILQGVDGVVDFHVGGTSDSYIAGLYYAKVKLGTPPREFNVQIDTGSDILWVTCSSCNDCPRTSGLGIDLNLFDPTSSSTAALVSCSDPACSSAIQTTSSQCSSQTNQCSYTFRYGDGSGTSGFYLSDMLYFDMVLGQNRMANSSAPIVFGCSTYQLGDLTHPEKAVDGIFGLGPQGLSVISQLSYRGITPKVFSHCLKGRDSGGGILVLGEILDPNIVYTPVIPSQPHYNVNLQSIAVNGKVLPIDPGVFATGSNQGTIVDSGTTLAYLVEGAYDPFVNAISSAVIQSATPVEDKGKQCYSVLSSVNDVFPWVSLNFEGGASLILKPEEYLVHHPVDGAMWCVGFEKARGQPTTILGDLVLKDKIVVYDLTRQRIGWADYDCSLSVNVSVTFGKDEFVNAGQLSTSSSSKPMLFGLAPAATNAHLLRFFMFIWFLTFMI